MEIKNYQEVTAEQVTDPGVEKTSVRWVISQKDGAPNFFMRVFEIEPGGCTPLHQHPWEHEVFVFEGQGVVVKEGQEMPLSPGTVVFVPPDESHQFKNKSGATLRFVCLIPAVKG